VDGDGRADVLVGNREFNSVDRPWGAAYLYFGTASGVAATPDTSLHNPRPSTSNGFGSTVAAAGDVDGDGLGDVLVAAGNEDRVFLYRGGSDGLSADPSETLRGSGWFGFALASAGDVDGDGHADVVIGAPRDAGGGVNAGKARVYYGGPVSLTSRPIVILTGTRMQAALGSGVI
jgi:hypothetical protein